MLEAAHLGVDGLENAVALLQAEEDVLLDLGELDAAHELLELLQLAVGPREQLLLVLFPPQREQGPRLVARRQHLPRHVRLAGHQGQDAPLVLLELVALEFEIEDGPVVKIRGEQ